jgi:hypothetical protein
LTTATASGKTGKTTNTSSIRLKIGRMVREGSHGVVT